MSIELRVLMVEDREEDAFHTIRALERGGYAPTWKRVEDEMSLRAALDESPWDIVLSDWSLPRFSGPDALRTLKETGLDVPFIIVSGTVGEDAAVEAMRSGACDYVVKGRLARLTAAVERELREHEERKARRRAEETLARTEKLRALGQMAAGVSHDLKNILNPLSLNLQLAGRAIDHAQYPEAREAIDEMKRVLTRGMQSLERLRLYGKQDQVARREEVDLDRLVHEAREIAKSRIAARRGPTPAFREELDAPRRFAGQPGDIVSALVNLIVNAIDAFTKSGTITLRTGERDGCVFAQVQDDGPGMPPEIERRAFEPFFTTKGADGTGLGLAMVFACMQRHGGTVSLETAPGEGTTFTLRFPVTSGDSRGS